MPDLYERVTAELDRLERIASRELRPAVTALRMVTERHRPTADIWLEVPVCHASAMPYPCDCAELHNMAVDLGVDVTYEPPAGDGAP